MGQIKVVVGGQFGSEGKGHVTGWLAKNDPRATAVVRVAGPNAGHSAVDETGHKWALRQVPIAAVTNPDSVLLLAPGSEIDPPVLFEEVDALDAAGFRVSERLHVDRYATVIESKHKEAEADAALTQRVGSTGKGIGAARSARIMRQAYTWEQYFTTRVKDEKQCKIQPARVSEFLRHLTQSSMDNIIIEGTQGYGLGLHTHYYPQTTSSDCRAIDFLAMAGISPWASGAEVEVYIVYRTYPIRVAGNSGPLANELTWEELAERTNDYIQPEKTTVTQKVRRIGEWDPTLARAALHANGGTCAAVRPVLLFLDYVFPHLAGHTNTTGWDAEVWKFIEQRSREIGQRIYAVGTGPNHIIKL